MSIPDKFHRDLEKIIKKANPQNLEELQQLLDTLTGKPIPEPKPADMTPEEQARELVWEAMECPPAKGRKLAQKALKLDPDCIEAYEYLGNSYQDISKALGYYEKAIEIGRRLFGGAFLKKYKGSFWGVTETRPFMRSLLAYADLLHRYGGTEKAIPILEELLKLNPGDNQGVRYLLHTFLLEVQDFEKFERLEKKYGEESSTFFWYDRALYRFLTKGDCPESVFALQCAQSSNKFVSKYLLAVYPPNPLPDAYSWGSKEEAAIYADMAWRAWLLAKGAKEWLRRNT